MVIGYVDKLLGYLAVVMEYLVVVIGYLALVLECLAMVGGYFVNRAGYLVMVVDTLNEVGRYLMKRGRDFVLRCHNFGLNKIFRSPLLKLYSVSSASSAHLVGGGSWGGASQITSVTFVNDIDPGQQGITITLSVWGSNSIGW